MYCQDCFQLLVDVRALLAWRVPVVSQWYRRSCAALLMCLLQKTMHATVTAAQIPGTRAAASYSIRIDEARP